MQQSYINTEDKTTQHLKRNNHYVPKMYLRQWATDNKVYEYDLLVSHENVPLWRLKPLESTASQENLYVRYSRKNEADDFEKFFEREFETPAVESLYKACNNLRMCMQDWDRLIDFVTAQYVRTPSFYLKTHDTFKSATEVSLDEVATELSNMTYEELKNHKHSNTDIDTSLLPLTIEITNKKADDDHTYLYLETVVGKSSWLMGIQHLLNKNSQLRREMRKIQWGIVETDSDVRWPTTDTPLAIYNPHFSPSSLIGISLPDNVFIFPISPTKALIARNKKRVPSRWTATYQEALEIKRIIINNAFLCVYSDRKDDEVELMRPRVVDETEYKRIHSQFSEWYSLYNSEEVPLLER